MTRFVQLENVNDPADIYVNPAAVNMVRAVGLDNAHVYFNNDYHGFALENAHTLARELLQAQFGPLPITPPRAAL